MRLNKKKRLSNIGDGKSPVKFLEPESSKEEQSGIVNLGIKISLPILEQYKPPFTTPFEYVMDNRTRNYLDCYERLLFRHKELVDFEFDVQDLMVKYFETGQQAFMHKSALHYELSHHLDRLFCVFITYTAPITYTLNALKQMNYVTFQRFCQDIGVDDKICAYIFFLCTRYEKTISDDIGGESDEEKIQYAYELMQVEQSKKQILMCFPSFLESIFRLVDHYKNPAGQFTECIIAFLDNILYQKCQQSAPSVMRLYLNHDLVKSK